MNPPRASRGCVPAATTSGSEPAAAIAFLQEAAAYFERRPTGGEDSAHWSNVMNAENCRSAAALIEHLWRRT